MIVQEDVPYTKEEVKAMVKTIHDLREKVSQLGWHPSSELPKDEEDVIAAGDYYITRAVFYEGKYYIAEYYYDPACLNCSLKDVKWWCYPPKEE